MKRLLCVLAILVGSLSCGMAAGLIVVDEAYWPQPVPPIHPPPDRPWPRPMPPPRVYPFAPLELSRHQAEVKIADQVAVTSIEQEFYNPNDRPVEGTFLLPLPKGAQIRKFSMEIDGKPAQAELLSAEKARGIYEDIVRKLKDPALLEYAGRDVYKVRIFPIEPRSKKRVSLSYTELLRSDSGLVSYTYPLSPEKFAAKPIPVVSLKVEVKTRQPLKSIYSPTPHRRDPAARFARGHARLRGERSAGRHGFPIVLRAGTGRDRGASDDLSGWVRGRIFPVAGVARD